MQDARLSAVLISNCWKTAVNVMLLQVEAQIRMDCLHRMLSGYGTNARLFVFWVMCFFRFIFELSWRCRIYDNICFECYLNIKYCFSNKLSVVLVKLIAKNTIWGATQIRYLQYHSTCNKTQKNNAENHMPRCSGQNECCKNYTRSLHQHIQQVFAHTTIHQYSDIVDAIDEGIRSVCTS